MNLCDVIVISQMLCFSPSKIKVLYRSNQDRLDLVDDDGWRVCGPLKGYISH